MYVDYARNCGRWRIQRRSCTTWRDAPGRYRLILWICHGDTLLELHRKPGKQRACTPAALVRNQVAIIDATDIHRPRNQTVSISMRTISYPIRSFPPLSHTVPLRRPLHDPSLSPVTSLPASGVRDRARPSLRASLASRGRPAAPSSTNGPTLFRGVSGPPSPLTVAAVPLITGPSSPRAAERGGMARGCDVESSSPGDGGGCVEMPIDRCGNEAKAE